jgi:hypothetical protein
MSKIKEFSLIQITPTVFSAIIPTIKYLRLKIWEVLQFQVIQMYHQDLDKTWLPMKF